MFSSILFLHVSLYLVYYHCSCYYPVLWPVFLLSYLLLFLVTWLQFHLLSGALVGLVHGEVSQEPLGSAGGKGVGE